MLYFIWLRLCSNKLGQVGINFASLVFPLPAGGVLASLRTKAASPFLFLFRVPSSYGVRLSSRNKKRRELSSSRLCPCGCGEIGIRTLGTVARTPHFECGPIDHSGISPFLCLFSSRRKMPLRLEKKNPAFDFLGGAKIVNFIFLIQFLELKKLKSYSET